LVGSIYNNLCTVSIYKVVQIWPGQTVTCLHTNRPGQYIYIYCYQFCEVNESEVCQLAVSLLAMGSSCSFCLLVFVLFNLVCAFIILYPLTRILFNSSCAYKSQYPCMFINTDSCRHKMNWISIHVSEYNFMTLRTKLKRTNTSKQKLHETPATKSETVK
jgi:hypothetical protein